MKFLPAGHNGLLVECESLAQVRQLYATLLRQRPAELIEIVPAARSLLLVGGGLDRLRRDLPDMPLQNGPEAGASLVEIPVTYDGEDLEEVADLTGQTPSDIIALHSSTEFCVAFCGFAPGFAYLSGLPESLRVPRRQTPRTRVETGSVALAGEFSGIYPRSSPGGWQIIGHTTLQVWDSTRDPPSLLVPGTRVRFNGHSS